MTTGRHIHCLDGDKEAEPGHTDGKESHDSLGRAGAAGGLRGQLPGMGGGLGTFPL